MTYRYYSLDVEGGRDDAAAVVAELGRRFQAENRNLPASMRQADIGYNLIPSFTADDAAERPAGGVLGGHLAPGVRGPGRPRRPRRGRRAGGAPPASAPRRPGDLAGDGDGSGASGAEHRPRPPPRSGGRRARWAGRGVHRLPRGPGRQRPLGRSRARSVVGRGDPPGRSRCPARARRRHRGGQRVDREPVRVRGGRPPNATVVDELVHLAAPGPRPAGRAAGPRRGHLRRRRRCGGRRDRGHAPLRRLGGSGGRRARALRVGLRRGLPRELRVRPDRARPRRQGPGRRRRRALGHGGPRRERDDRRRDRAEHRRP